MNKVLTIVLSFILLLSVCSGCSPSEQPVQDIDNLLQEKTDSENENEAEYPNTDSDSVTKEEFISVWPDVLPITTNRPDGHRPIEIQAEINPGEWVSKFTYESMYLYDFPNPLNYFDYECRNSMVLNVWAIYFAYSNDDENGQDRDISVEEFKEFVDVVKKYGYTDNSVETETSYYCEKYGVGLSLVLGKDFAWPEDEPRLADRGYFKETVQIRLQLINPEYEMDLEAIKAEEYKRWLESH